MALEIELQSVLGKLGPERRLELGCRFRWHRNSPAFLLGLDGRLYWGESVLTDSVRVQQVQWRGENPALLELSNTYYSATLVAPLTLEAIHFIEQQRRGGDVSLKLEVRYRWQEALFDAEEVEDFIHRSGGTYVGGQVHWQKCDCGVPIPHSEWLKRLREIQWGERELFEMAVVPLQKHPDLGRALELLHQAEVALRLGRRNSVLADCYSACESAAKHMAESNNKAHGWNLLLEGAMPESVDKRDRLNELIKRLMDYTQIGRHEGPAAVPISSEEAGFALTTTLGLFSMLSRRLANKGAL
jgi:hypothetical protein